MSSTRCSPPASCTGSTPSTTSATSSCASAATPLAMSSSSPQRPGSKSCRTSTLREARRPPEPFATRTASWRLPPPPRRRGRTRATFRVHRAEEDQCSRRIATRSARPLLIPLGEEWRNTWIARTSEWHLTALDASVADQLEIEIARRNVTGPHPIKDPDARRRGRSRCRCPGR